jgi:hypothetical protein
VRRGHGVLLLVGLGNCEDHPAASAAPSAPALQEEQEQGGWDDLDRGDADSLRALLVPGSTRASAEFANSLREGPATLEGVLGFGFELSVFAEGTCASADPHRVLWLDLETAQAQRAIREAAGRDGGETWVAARAEGSVLRGPAGHLDLYPGVFRVTRVLRAEPCASP